MVITYTFILLRDLCGYRLVNIGLTHFIHPKGMDWSEYDFVVNAK